MRAVIEVIAGKDKGRQFTIRKNQVVVFGRTEWSDVTFASDPQMSGKHFSLENNSDLVTLRDLGSTNGTQVNGEFVESASLQDGDQVTAGLTTFTMRIDMTMDSATAGQMAGQSGAPIQHAPPPVQAPPNQPGPAESPPSSPVTPIGSPIVYDQGSSPVTQDQPPVNADIAPAEVPPSSPIVLPGSTSDSPVASPSPPPSAESPISPVAPPTSSPIPDSSGASDVASSPIAAPPQAPDQARSPDNAAPSTAPPPAQPAPPAQDKVLDKRRPVSYTGSRTVVKHRLKNGLLKYELQLDPNAPPQDFYPSTLMPMFSNLGAPVGFAHFQKAGIEKEAGELKTARPVFGFLPDDIARVEGPVLFSPDQTEDMYRHLDELWDADAALCYFCSDASAATDHLLAQINPPPKKEGAATKLVGLCWPSVCEAMLTQGEDNNWNDYLGTGINAVLLEQADKKGAWMILATNENVDGVLSQSGFNLIEPPDNTEQIVD